jgi:hydroxymethylpyrimidine/phosphomethylpyrimidine kinase
VRIVVVSVPVAANQSNPQSNFQVPVALTIAGSDSGGGAGIQADLKAFAFHRVHGTSALTCITAQNTLGVNRIDALPPESVVAQIAAVMDDIGVQAAKTGMLLNREIIAAIADYLQARPIQHLVVDPVMVSRAGAQLLDDDAVALMRDRLIPLATIVTPNRHEAQLLTGREITTLADMQQAAQQIYQLGAQAVLVKGGGMAGELRGVDVWFDGQTCDVIRTQTIDTPNTHGTGCTLGAAIVANLAIGYPPLTAVANAKDYLTQALQYSLSLGQGQGPVGHFFPILPSNLGALE